MKVTEAILQHVADSLRGLKDGEVYDKASALAKHYGCSVPTIYVWAKKKGLRWRKERATKGKTKADAEAVKQTAALVYASKRANKDVPLPVCDAIEMLKDSGVLMGDVSDDRITSLMRERQMSTAALVQPSPHVNMLSEHPNHVWQFDVTNCLQYFLDDKGMGERDADMELYKNKIVKTAKKIKKELLRYVAVDHCSGAFFFWYYYSTGERAMDGADFLYKAFRPKDELIEATFNGTSASKKGKYHMHGVPLMLVPDRGSIIVDKANNNLFEGLRITVEPHMPGNPRAKGLVEWLMSYLRRFEARLKFKRPRDLAELNAWALDYCIAANALKVTRGIAPRSALWQKIRPEQLRLCPDEHVYKMLIRKPAFEATANGACIIRVDNRQYRIPDSNASRKKVNVVINPYEYPALEAHFNGYVWLLQPIAIDEYGRLSDGVKYGEHRSWKETDTQKVKKDLEQIATDQWGISWKGNGDKRIAVAPPLGHETPLQVFGHQSDKVKVQFINRPGVELEVKQPEMPENRPLTHDAHVADRSILNRRIPIMEFFKQLKNEIQKVSPKLNQQLRAEFGASITKSKAEEVIAEIKAGTYTLTQPSPLKGEGYIEGEDRSSTREDKEAAAM